MIIIMHLLSYQMYALVVIPKTNKGLLSSELINLVLLGLAQKYIIYYFYIENDPEDSF